MTPAGPATIADALDHVLAVDPDRVAVAGPSGTLTYAELDAAANAVAALLAESGVGRGDRLAAALPNDLAVVVAFHAAMRLGAVWVGINRALAPPEKDALLALARPSLVLADPAAAAELTATATAPAEPGRPRPTAAVLTIDPGDPEGQWHAALRTFAGAERPPAPDPEAPAGIAFTSGTTGRPRGVVHSQRNLLLPAASLVASRGYDASLRKGDCLPLTILNLLVLTTLVTSAAGGRCVLTDRRDARGVAQWIGRESLTVWNGVPAQLYTMTRDPEIDPRWFASLREVWSGGADCPDELVSAFQSRFGVPVCATYGLTEAPTVVTIDPVGHHVAGASGRALPHLDLRVVDGEGKPLPARAVGEITVGAASDGPWRGAYHPMLGHWDEGGLEPFTGELRTGDLGYLDEQGWLFVQDRKKLLIIRGGANVYPAEVERVLGTAPGVAAAVVMGVPDARLGQRVVAVAERAPGQPATEETLIDYCRARLARYKVPERIVLVDSLPRNAMGKVQREPLRSLVEPAGNAGPAASGGAGGGGAAGAGGR